MSLPSGFTPPYDPPVSLTQPYDPSIPFTVTQPQPSSPQWIYPPEAAALTQIAIAVNNLVSVFKELVELIKKEQENR